MRKVVLQIEKTGLMPGFYMRELRQRFQARLYPTTSAGPTVPLARDETRGTGCADQNGARRAKITFYSFRCCGMRIAPSILRPDHYGFSTPVQFQRRISLRLSSACLLLAGLSALYVRAQDDPLNKVHVPPPSAAGTPATGAGAPAGAEAAPATGTAATKARPGALIRMNVDMVLVPVTVTDPMNRLVTGLEQRRFSDLRKQRAAGHPHLCQRGCPGFDRHHL